MEKEHRVASNAEPHRIKAGEVVLQYIDSNSDIGELLNATFLHLPFLVPEDCLTSFGSFHAALTDRPARTPPEHVRYRLDFPILHQNCHQRAEGGKHIEKQNDNGTLREEH